MNRTGIIIAVSAATLLGVGGWFTRSWWWGGKPATDKSAATAKLDKSKSQTLEKKVLGESEPAARTAAAKMHNRFENKSVGKPGAASEEAPLSSDEADAPEEEMPKRPSNRFASRVGRASEEEEPAAPEETPAAGEETATAGESTGSEATTEETGAATAPAEEMTTEETQDTEQAKPEESAAGAGTETTTPETTEESTPAARLAQRNTSRAPPLRSEEEAAEDTQPTAEKEVVRIEEAPRAAKALAPRSQAPVEPETTDEEPTTPRSLKVAKPLERPPTLENGSKFGGESPARPSEGGREELTSLLSRSTLQPQEAPGDRRLEGEQSAPLTLTKSAPSEVSVGRPAVFETRVRNSGASIAHQVVVMDRVPRGARLIEATPQYSQTPEGLLIWDLGNLDPGQEALIKMQLMPEEEGEIGSVATVTNQLTASARAVSTRPQLEVEHTAPAKVLVGEDVTFKIRVHNPGTGVARSVRIEEDVPRGLSHDEGRQLEHEIGDLKPGETRQLELTLTAAEAGGVSNVVRVRGEGDLAAEHTTELEVLAPKIVTEIKGPKRRYLDRQATYSLRIANPGTAAARMVEFSAQLPTGLKFISADNSGRYDARKHAVFWKVENLPAGQEGVVQMVVTSTASGQQSIRCTAKSGGGLEASSELAVLVEAAPETTFTVRDTSDQIEVGAESVYEIVVSNHGTRADSQVQISAVLPAELQIVDAEGPTGHQVDGQRVVFEPLAKLDPKSEATYKIKVKAVAAAADPRVVKVQATSSALTTPVSREESTLIYEDR